MSAAQRLQLLALAALLLGCSSKSRKHLARPDGRTLSTSQQTLTINGIQVTGKLPSNWHKHVRRQSENHRDVAPVTYFGFAPGLYGPCAQLAIRIRTCKTAKCVKRAIGKLPKIGDSVWGSSNHHPPVVMGAKRRGTVLVVHKLESSMSLLECSGTYECDDNEKMILNLKDLCTGVTATLVRRQSE